MSIVLKNCRFVVTQNSEQEILENCDILISGNQIKEIGENLQGEQEIDCSQNIVIPGLINLHTHTGMHLLRGIADDMELHKWLNEKIWPAERKLTVEDKYRATKAAINEMLQTGTTCFNDMYFSMERIADAVKETGIRAVLSHGMIDLGDKEKFDKEFAEARKVRDYIKNLNCSRIQFAVGPHSPYACSKELILKAQDLAEQHNALVHIHISEDKRDEIFREYLDANVIAAHCCHLSDDDIKLFAEKGVKVAHCPRSNMKLASGVLPLKKLIDAGICIGLGTDSAVSNNNLDMFEEMHAAALLHKLHNMDATVAPAQLVLDMATINGAKALGINAGSVEEGKLADLVLLDANHFLLQPLEKERIISHLVYSANGSCVQKVIVDGK